MSKKLTISIFAGIILAGVIMTAALASGSLPGSGWWTTEVVQNVGASTANVSVTAYSSSSASTYITTTSVISSWATTVLPSDFSGMPSGFNGSAVVSADQPIVGLGYITNRQSGSFGVAGGKGIVRYQGMSSPASTLYFPVIKHNWFNLTSLFYLQNTGVSSVTATAVFVTGLSTPTSYTYTTPLIGPNKMVVVSPADAGVPTGPSDVNTRVNIGSLTVTSSGMLAGMYIDYKTTENPSLAINGTRALTPTDIDVKAYNPAVKNNWAGRYSGIPILNVDSVPITVSVKYVGTNGACAGSVYTDTVNNLKPKSQFSVVLQTGLTNVPDTCLAAATLTGTGNFVALGNEANTSSSPSAGSAVYALPDNSKTTKVAVPVFMDDRLDAFRSGLQIQNAGSSTATNVVAKFYCYGNGTSNTPFTATSKPLTITPGSTFLFYRPFATQASSFATPFAYGNALCSVIVTGDQPLLALVNEVAVTSGAFDDAKWEGFNLAP
jgi:hypothetical protein